MGSADLTGWLHSEKSLHSSSLKQERLQESTSSKSLNSVTSYYCATKNRELPQKTARVLFYNIHLFFNKNRLQKKWRDVSFMAAPRRCAGASWWGWDLPVSCSAWGGSYYSPLWHRLTAVTITLQTGRQTQTSWCLQYLQSTFNIHTNTRVRL